MYYSFLFKTSKSKCSLYLFVQFVAPENDMMVFAGAAGEWSVSRWAGFQSEAAQSGSCSL